MVPRIGGQGSSFKGAAAYYLHDKGADSDRRVAFTQTRNLPTDDPEMAWRWMAKTAMDSERLKHEARVDRRGAKSEKPVFTFSLSWHPDERPEQEHMIGALEHVLDRLGLADRQVLMVAHNDEPQPHIHAIVNLVHPETGLSPSKSLKFSKEKLSKWAEEYERKHGIYCEQRLTNNRRREKAAAARDRKDNDARERNAAFPRYKETELDLKAEITRRYFECDSGQAFQASVEQLGYRLAQGRRLVLVDQNGKQFSLYRQINGASAKEIKAKLRGIQFRDVDAVRQDLENQRRQRPGSQRVSRPQQEANPPTRDLGQQRSDVLNDLQDRKHAALAALSNRHVQERLVLDETLSAQYGDDARRVARDIAALEGRLKGSPAKVAFRKLAGKLSRNGPRDLANQRRTLANIQQRMDEARGAVNERQRQESAALASTFASELASAETGFRALGYNEPETRSLTRDAFARAHAANADNLTADQLASAGRAHEAPAAASDASVAFGAATDSGYAARRAARLAQDVSSREGPVPEEGPAQRES